jgi:hypothetical protein
MGLFARLPIAAGTVVARLGGRVVSQQELDGLFAAASLHPDRPYIDTIALTETSHLVLPSRDEHPVAYGNHSCDPNLWWDRPWTLIAHRDIQQDEELTNDYATSTADPQFAMACSCRAPNRCRQTITGNDWQLPELRARYGGHWVPALLARIASAP